MKSRRYILFLDDNRDPVTTTESPAREIVDMMMRQHPDAELVWARTSKEFQDEIVMGMPLAVSLDHDIGEVKEGGETTGLSCAKWLCEKCITDNVKLPEYFCHSSNPAGFDNIIGMFKFYIKHNLWMI